MPWRQRLRRAARVANGAYRVARAYNRVKNVGKAVRNALPYKRKDRGVFPRAHKRAKMGKSLSKVTRNGNHSWQTTVNWGKYRGKVPKALRQNHPTNIWVNQLTERLASFDEGQQGINQIVAGASMFTLGQMQAFFDGGEDASNATERRYLKSGTLKIRGTNNTNQNIKLTLYNVTLKNDMKWALTANPVNAWERGYSLEGAAGNHRLNGSTPYDSGYFGQFYTIWKTSNFFLSQGESFQHVTNVHINKEVGMGKIWDLTNQPIGTTSAHGYGGLKGITQWVIIAMEAFPSHETTINTNITTSIAAVDLIYLQKGTYVKNVIEQKIFTPISVLSITPASALQVINEDTGLEVATFAG